MTVLRNLGKRDKKLAPIAPNAQTRIKYQRALAKAMASMQASYAWWLKSKYESALVANQCAGRLAQDANGPSDSADDLFGELQRLRNYWRKYFDKFSRDIAEKTVKAWYADNTTQWSGKLKRAGFDVPLALGDAQQLFLKTAVAQNVALIKSIQEQYHTDVAGVVLRDFARGRDLQSMAADVSARGRVAQNRAAFIARDQANKATAQLNDTRQRDLGIEYAEWKHSSAGKEPRHSHLKAGRDGWVFKIGAGIDFGDQFGAVLPGEAINCRCTSRSIIPALGRGPGLMNLEPVTGFPGAYRERR